MAGCKVKVGGLSPEEDAKRVAAAREGGGEDFILHLLHVDAVKPGMRVLLVDDLLATGGTLVASTKLIGPSGLGATIVGASVLIELEFLKGRANLPDLRIESLLRY
jgi:adenine/guanine phosphoribosyltransferase-like PRPP-binding protein